MSLAGALAGVLLAIYLLVGALDLGVGMLLLLLPRGRDRDAVLGGGGRPWSAGAVWTLIAFALVVAGLPASLAALRALWPALVLMLLALALRGGLSALRPQVLRRDLVDLGFGLASLAAAGCQGLALGWAVAGLGSGLPSRHAGPLGTLSVWGLLCAAGVVGASAMLGSGWLVWSGRGAVRVFGREVGRAAAILLAGALALCTLWAAWPTGVAGRAFAGGWASATPPALLAAASLVLLVAFGLSLWGRRPAVPMLWATLSVLCGLAGAMALLSTLPSRADAPGEIWSAAYLAFVLLLGAPLPVLDVLRRWNARTRDVDVYAGEGAASHAGRRARSLANNLHLS